MHGETRYLNWLGEKYHSPESLSLHKCGVWEVSPTDCLWSLCPCSVRGGIGSSTNKTSHFGRLREITLKIGYLTKSLTWSTYFVGKQCKYQVTAHIPGFVSEESSALEQCLACSG